MKRNDIVRVDVWEGGRQAERYYPGTNDDGDVRAVGALVPEQPVSISTEALGALGAVGSEPRGIVVTGAVGAIVPASLEKPNAPTARAKEEETGPLAAPNATNAPAPSNNGNGQALTVVSDGSRALDADEFLDELATTKTSTLAGLLDWRNAHGATFVLSADGLVSVADETDLTPSLKAAIQANQETLRLFASAPTSASPSTSRWPIMEAMLADWEPTPEERALLLELEVTL